MSLLDKISSPKNKSQTKKDPAKKSALLESEKIYQKGLATVKDIIAPAAFKIEPDHVMINKKLATTFFVYA